MFKISKMTKDQAKEILIKAKNEVLRRSGYTPEGEHIHPEGFRNYFGPIMSDPTDINFDWYEISDSAKDLGYEEDLIRSEQGRRIIDNLLKIRDFDDAILVKEDERIPWAFDFQNLSDRIDQLASMDFDTSILSCRSGCTGLCIGSCGANCTKGCSDECTTCSSQCVTGCTSECTGCSTTCGTSCGGTCGNGCEAQAMACTGCTAGCSGCTFTCSSTCYSGCYTGCSGTCGWQCTGNVSGVCGACDTNCTGTCENKCLSGCSGGCTGCNTTCGDSCGACDGSCLSSSGDTVNSHYNKKASTK